MKGKRSVVTVIIFFLCAICAFFAMRDKADVQAKKLIEYFDQQRETNGRLPTSPQADAFIKTLGNDEELGRGPFYKIEGNEFTVWYGRRLGESHVYDSRTKKWHDEG